MPAPVGLSWAMAPRAADAEGQVRPAPADAPPAGTSGRRYGLPEKGARGWVVKVRQVHLVMQTIVDKAAGGHEIVHHLQRRVLLAAGAFVQQFPRTVPR